ncbi:MAG: glycine--tRNA ligase subunit beta [Deltaproteobacteria bacterium]|nr:glycine--tRNA ligase subunit beta [Deltaproteobacteria bacterium]
MGKELLLEIGTEEIPAAFLPQARRDLEEMIRKELAAQVIPHGAIITMATPRRLFLCVAEVAEKQSERIIEKLGPAKRAAFDAQGNPTPAAQGFARGQGVEISALETIVTEKGEYLVSRKKITGAETKTLLPQIIPALIAALPFRKSMRWADFELRFARPIHWLLALYGGETIPFALENIQSGNLSYGHRFLSPAPFKVSSLADYLTGTRENFVIADPEERRRIILADAEKEAQSLGGKVFYDQDLLDTITYIVEYPTVISGSFDVAYLALPKEVLITSMMTQQKYFPLTDGQGNLLNHFLTVSNTRPRDVAVVRRGNEKVIRARLSDARFFFEEDGKIPLEERLENLHGMIFHTLLGTVYEKVMRFRSLAGELALLLNPALKDRVLRVATLAKADLSTQMVGEFPELQGVMGREYALLAGEDPLVAKGIYEHYLPVSATGALPETEEGALASIADKMVSITGFFGVNLIPTGTADPYALRRQSLGIINIILARKYPLPLDVLIDKSLLIWGERLKRPADEIKADILAFFQSRFANQLISQGRPYDVVDSVLSIDATDLVKSLNKIEALATLKDDAGFEPLASAFKRVGNIIKDFPGGTVDPGLFESEAEQNLYNVYLEIKEKVALLIESGDYLAALREIARLRQPVDNFFDAVLVMAEDEKIRFNRLSLLAAISSIFRQIADFSRIVTP